MARCDSSLSLCRVAVCMTDEAMLPYLGDGVELPSLTPMVVDLSVKETLLLGFQDDFTKMMTSLEQIQTLRPHVNPPYLTGLSAPC